MKSFTGLFCFYNGCGVRERSKGVIETRFVGEKVVCFIKPTDITGEKKRFFQAQSFFMSDTETKDWKN